MKKTKLKFLLKMSDLEMIHVGFDSRYIYNMINKCRSVTNKHLIEEGLDVKYTREKLKKYANAMQELLLQRIVKFYDKFDLKAKIVEGEIFVLSPYGKSLSNTRRIEEIRKTLGINEHYCHPKGTKMPSSSKQLINYFIHSR